VLALAALLSCHAGVCARQSDCAPAQACTFDGICAARVEAGIDATSDAAPADAAPDAVSIDGRIYMDAKIYLDAGTAGDATTD
jgi:hypothetical protein